jgi:hypothetical protein
VIVVCHETRARVRVALWAYAYEVKQDPLVDDATFDAVAATIDVTTATKRPDLDEFFRKEFSPDTGQWVWKHPEIDKLEAMYRMQRKPEGANWLRIGAEIYERG